MKSLAKNSWIRLLAGLHLTYDSASPSGSEVIGNHLDMVTKRIREVIDQKQLINPDMKLE